MRYNILVIDDNNDFSSSIKLILKDYNVKSVPSIEKAKEELSDDLDIILLDLVFDENKPDTMQGMELLPYIKQKYSELPVIIMTNFASIDKSVIAIKKGAKDFFRKKELDWDEWKNRIKNYCRDYRKIKRLEEQARESEKENETAIIGESEEIIYLRKKIKDLAENSNDVSIFIQGETGTGKNLAVKYFRHHSQRKDNPYQEFSITEKSENLLESELFGHEKGSFTDAKDEKIGLFQAADKGILFLDEIGDYSLQIQAKIMRFLEDKQITPVGSTKPKQLDVQLILATNKNLQQLIKEKKFRDDLYYRINRIKIEIPPLRERGKDIIILTNYFFKHFRKKEKTNLVEISEEVYKILKNYTWPGNIRELQSVIWNACTEARLYDNKILQRKHLKKELLTNRNTIKKDTVSNYRKKKVEIELQAIDEALCKTLGQKAKAAKLLGMTADQMRYRIITFCYSTEYKEKFRNIKHCYKL